MIVYLDNSSTTKQYDEVTKIMLKCMQDEYGNPSSLHSMGFASEKIIKKSREQVSEALSRSGLCASGEGYLFFNSGGTESDNTAIMGAAKARRRYGNKLITSEAEHPAVLESFKRLEEEGFEISLIGIDENCRIDMDQLKSEINEKTILISLMKVNNETGAIQPVLEAAEQKKNALFHTDAVQAFCRVPHSVQKADMISISSHKIHGPKGAGALWIKKVLNIKPLILGGGQKNKFRSGTENVPAIAGFGIAAEKASDGMEEKMKRMAGVRKYLLEGIKKEIQDIRVNSPAYSCYEKNQENGESLCSPSILNISFLGTRGEVILHSLEQEGIFVSTGAACSSNKKAKSHVLSAMGLSEKESEGAIRFSLSEVNTIEEMDRVVYNLKKAVDRFRKLGSLR